MPPPTPACVRTKWMPSKVTANRNNRSVYIGCCTEGGGGFGFATTCNEGGGGEIATFTRFTMAWQALWLNTWPLGILILNCGWPMLSHIWILATPLFHRFQNTLGPIPQIPHYIVTYSTASIIYCDLFYCFDNWLGPIPQLPWLIGTYSTASIIDWDLFQCLIIYFVTLSTDATFCDLRHNCISKINSHLWNRAQFLVEIITIFLWPIPQCSISNSTISSNCDQFHNFK